MFFGVLEAIVDTHEKERLCKEVRPFGVFRYDACGEDVEIESLGMLWIYEMMESCSVY